MGKRIDIVVVLIKIKRRIHQIYGVLYQIIIKKYFQILSL